MKKLTLALLLLVMPLFVQPRDGVAQLRDLQLSLSCPALPMVMDGLLSSHINYSKEDDALARRVAGLYARQIDPTQTLLTQAEFDKLEKRLFKLVKSVRKGDCKDFAQLKKEQIAWQKDMENYVRKVTADGFEIDSKRVVELDPDKRKRPKNAAEQKELRRALIDFQMANYLANGTEMKEAREKLVHRYELFTKRVKEQDEQDLYAAFLNAYSTALDPHSTYFSPDDVEDFRIQMELSLTGIGAVLSSQDGYTIVQEVVPGGAADRHGKLQPKDKIIEVIQGKDGEPVDIIDMELREVVKMIRGKKGTKVTLTVLRQGADTERLQFTIERDKIDLKEQAAKLKWHEVERRDKKLKLAVIDLPSFYAGDGPDARDSARDVAKLVEKAKKAKADGILLDLSRNGGGALQSAVTISGLFIELGPVVGVGDKAGKPDVLNDRDPKVQWDGPLVVLTSKASASASEILAGALQDYRRAVVVGDAHTFGKGTVQQLNQLPAGLGLLKVTTSLFFLPGGKSTQSVGVPADIVIPSAFTQLDIGEKHQRYALDPVSVKKFANGKANASKKWKPVSSKVIAQLERKSKKRVATSSEFKELEKELAKAGANDTKIKIAEILENGKDGEESEEEDKKKDDELSLQAKEAAQVLADLILALN